MASLRLLMAPKLAPRSLHEGQGQPIAGNRIAGADLPSAVQWLAHRVRAAPTARRRSLASRRWRTHNLPWAAGAGGRAGLWQRATASCTSMRCGDRRSNTARSGRTRRLATRSLRETRQHVVRQQASVDNVQSALIISSKKVGEWVSSDAWGDIPVLRHDLRTHLWEG